MRSQLQKRSGEACNSFDALPANEMERVTPKSFGVRQTYRRASGMQRALARRPTTKVEAHLMAD